MWLLNLIREHVSNDYAIMDNKTYNGIARFYHDSGDKM